MAAFRKASGALAGAAGAAAGLAALAPCSAGACTACFGCAGAGAGMLALLLFQRLRARSAVPAAGDGGLPSTPFSRRSRT